VLERAIQRGTVNVVICRLRYRLAAVTQPPAARSPVAAAEPDPSIGRPPD
jgi:hypothetical protein